MRRPKPRSLRKNEQKIRNRLVISVILTGIILFGVFVWVIPFLIGFLTHPNPSVANTQVDETITPPRLDINFEATNSATIDISGSSNPNQTVAIFLDNQQFAITDTDSSGKFLFSNFKLNPDQNTIFAKSIDSKGKISLPSKKITIKYSSSKPTLKILSPDDQKTFSGSDKVITISGQTESENSVNINNRIAIVNNDGQFSQDLELQSGQNTITIQATNTAGNNTVQILHLTYSP